jgi:ribosome maturation factor RimP
MLMADTNTQIHALVEPILEQEEVELVDLEIKGSRRNPVIKIFVDVPGGISIDACTHLARLIRRELDSQDMALENYRLEVSSPGIDRPLRTMRDFQRNIGRLVEVIYENDEGKTQSIQGDIVDADAEFVNLETADHGRMQIALDRINKALIQIKWSSSGGC